ncbi:unnamed protein product, partial [Amoebophrya sp. A25]|eukprot:GSA25T00007435001.1
MIPEYLQKVLQRLPSLSEGSTQVGEKYIASLAQPLDSAQALLSSLRLQQVNNNSVEECFRANIGTLHPNNANLVLRDLGELATQFSGCIHAWQTPLQQQGCTPTQQRAIKDYHTVVARMLSVQRELSERILRPQTAQDEREHYQLIYCNTISAQSMLLGALQITMNQSNNRSTGGTSSEIPLTIHASICARANQSRLKKDNTVGPATLLQAISCELFGGDVDAPAAAQMMHMDGSQAAPSQGSNSTTSSNDPAADKYFHRLREKLRESMQGFLLIEEFRLHGNAIQRLSVQLKTSLTTHCKIQIRAIKTHLHAERISPPLATIAESSSTTNGGASSTSSGAASSSTETQAAGSASSASPGSATANVNGTSSSSPGGTSSFTGEKQQQASSEPTLAQVDQAVALWLQELNEHAQSDEKISLMDFITFGYQKWKIRFEHIYRQCREIQGSSSSHNRNRGSVEPGESVPSLEEQEAIRQFLEGIPLFARMIQSMSEENGARQSFLSCIRKQHFPPGSEVFRQSEKGNEFYIVQSGVAQVWAHEENFLKVGDKVRNIKEVHFGGRKVPVGSLAVVDKFDQQREYPYTIRIVETG